MTTPKVTIVGSYIVALVMDVDRIPLVGETLHGKNYHVTHGGKGSNMAACAARLGASVEWLGKIGRDAFGEGFVQLLKEEGVAQRGVLTSETLPTATGFILFAEDGSNAIVIDSGANADFVPKDIAVNEHILAESEVSLSPLEIPLETALAAAEVATKHGKKFVLNPAPAVDLRKHDLSNVYAITPNSGEGRVCLGLPPDYEISDDKLAAQLLELGVANVLLTVGEEGVLWASKEGVVRVPALPVNVVDTVGAGDAFNAGLAVGLSEQRPIEEAIALGVTTASLSTRARETIASYAQRSEVDQHLPTVLQSIQRA